MNSLEWARWRGEGSKFDEILALLANPMTVLFSAKSFFRYAMPLFNRYLYREFVELKLLRSFVDVLGRVSPVALRRCPGVPDLEWN